MKHLLSAFVSLALVAQAPEKQDDLLDLLELLSQPVSVASKKASTIREQPGIVSLVTRQEIQSSGARDLIDILHMVPGFSFGKDVQGAVGPGLRGLWGYEGKVLLLVDGMELNDPLYGTLHFGGHIPADVIQRVEIIRGPGSAIYGGHAELAVINVITRGPEDMKGGYFSTSLGRIEGTDGRRSSTAALRGVFPNGKYSVSLATSQMPRSNAEYEDYEGSRFDMSHQTDIRSTFASLGVEYFGVQFRGLMDRYHIQQREHWGSSILPDVVTQTWDNYYLDLKRTFKLTDTLSLTPSLQFRRQFPWGARPPASDPDLINRNKRVDRNVLALQMSYDPSDKLNILAGAETYQQKGKAFLNRDQGQFANGKTEQDYDGKALYAQGLLQTDWVNVTLGARYETHSLFESSFVPRVGLTKVFDRFHFKLLVSKAFRSPAFEAININKNLKPEKTTATELEAGYQLTKSSFLVLNVFDTSINRPIIYFVDADGNDAYDNYEKMGSRGAEVEYRLQHKYGQLSFSYSMYSQKDNKVAIYSVPKDDSHLLAFPRQKLVLNGSIKLTENWNFFAGLVHIGERYAWLPDHGNPEGKLDKLPAVPLLNFCLSYKGAGSGLEWALGGHNLLKKDFSYAQAYGYQDVASGQLMGFQSPIPGQPQEFFVRLSYSY